MMATIELLDFRAFPVEVFDDAEGEVLIFNDPALLAEFQECERTGEEFDRELVRVRIMELQDQLRMIAFELDSLLPVAA